jgi:hypothetical protein
MKLPLSTHPFLAVAVVDDLVIIIALPVIIAAALISIAITLWKHWGRTSSGGGSTPDPGQQALKDLQNLLQKIKDQPGPVTPEQCQEMRDLLAKARSGGIGGLVIDALKQKIDQLCPG